MNLHEDIRQIGIQARQASRALLQLNTRRKNAIIEAMADALDADRAAILTANDRDAVAGREAGLDPASLDPLLLNTARLTEISNILRDVAAQPDPVGTTLSRWLRPNGLEIVKRRVPIGVIAVICESCPSVAVSAVALCLKSGNAIILRAGHDGAHTNAALMKAIIEGGIRKGLPPHAAQFVHQAGPEAVRELVQLEGYVDLAIPRGGEGLLRAVVESARVPVLRHYKGICHIYIDPSADLAMATAIVLNAKCQRPGATNALETVLVHADIAGTCLPSLAVALAAQNVAIRGDEAVRGVVPGTTPATEFDWYTEHRERVLCIRVVPSAEAAIAHINQCGTHHSDAIIAEDEAVQRQFTQDVDSAAVYVNASTRFTSGEEFGMGAEVGISTDKLHARGPVGLEELTTTKYVINGNGQIRQ